MTDGQILSDDPGAAVAETVRLELARSRRSRQWLADEAGISLSTLEKALSGRRRFSLSTIVRLEDALGCSLRPGTGRSAAHGTAPTRLGAYTREAASWLEQDYVMLRPSAGEAGSVYAHRLTIYWDREQEMLRFIEGERVDAAYTQGGEVGLSSLSGHTYLVTNELGQYRLAILGRPAAERAMYGILTTLQLGRGTAMMPAASAVALLPMAADAKPVFGRISPGDAVFERYRAHLDRVIAEDYARLQL